MLSSAEHEISSAYKYGKYQEILLFSGSDEPRMLFLLLKNVKMPTVLFFFFNIYGEEKFYAQLH